MIRFPLFTYAPLIVGVIVEEDSTRDLNCSYATSSSRLDLWSLFVFQPSCQKRVDYAYGFLAGMDELDELSNVIHKWVGAF